MRLLLIEDDLDLQVTLAEDLRVLYSVDVSCTGKEGIYLAELNPYDTIILDIGLPDMDGLTVCSRLRASGVTSPIIMLTGQSLVATKVAALTAGADDYLTKPFEVSELVARIQALMRRIGQGFTPDLRAGCITLNSASREVLHSGKPITLRRKEFDLLEFLLRNQNIVVTREMLLEHVWDSNVNSFTNAIDVHISRLREQIDKPFGTNLIETVYGFGYRINPSLMVQSSLVTSEKSR